MTIEEFKALLAKSRPPAGLSPALVALWWAGKDDWKKAHPIVMDESSKECACGQSRLHGVEGDLDNARSWYRQAKRTAAAGSFPDEWDDIARTLLGAK